MRDRRFSFELFPPKTEAGRKRFPSLIRELAELGPSFVSVTFGAGGSTREGSFQTCADILRSTSLPVTPHLSCIGSQREELAAQLDMYQEIGVRRVMALRGDVPENEPDLPRAFRYASELVAFIRARGDFHISVACYPEFRPEARSPEADVQAFVTKARAGADEAISQYFFSNDAYYRFVEWVQKLGVEIPIVPGLMPIVDFAQVVRFSKFCGADIPSFIRKRMEQYEGDAESQKQLGIELAIRQAEQLLAAGAPGIHFYTLNRSEPTALIWKALGLRPAGQADRVSQVTA